MDVSFFGICVVVGLSVLNWFLEIVKWKILVSGVKKTRFSSALHQSLGALTASLFTPNRIGEYGAKALYFTADLRKRIVLISILGNLLQMGVTLCFGVLGFTLLFFNFNFKTNLASFVWAPFLLFIIILLSLFLLKKSNISIKGVSLKTWVTHVTHFSKIRLRKAIVLSIARYITFTSQFLFLLLLFNLNIDYIYALSLIALTYLLASVIPSIFIFDVVVKSSVAAYLFSLAGISETPIVCITTIMWLLNFVLPSLFGSYCIMQFTFPKKSQLI
ncbi:flippase-like domain-containing protein [Tamlana fucoidanivorans]